ARRVQRAAFQITRPIDFWGAEPRLPTTAPAERMKSRYSESPNEAPGWTLPTFRDVASHTQAVCAGIMIDSRSYFPMLAAIREESHQFGGDVDAAGRGQRFPAGHGVHLDHVQLAVRP